MNKHLRRVYMALIYLFLYAPILVLMVFSFNAGKNRGRWEGFSLKWYQSLMGNEAILLALRNTLLVALLATLFATLIGSLGALAIYYYRKRAKRALTVINQIIVINPDIVTAVGFMALYALFRLPSGFATLLLSHVGFCVPYVVLSVLPRLVTMPKALPEAAMDLGATPLQTLRYVVLPYMKPGIVSGALMAFTISIDDFAISFFTTGNGVDTISTLVYSMARRGINPEINAMSTLLFLAMLLLLLSVNKKSLQALEGGI